MDIDFDHIDLTGFEKEGVKLIGQMNHIYTKTLEQYLVEVYHKLIHDCLTVDDIQEIGERANLDIEATYDRITQQIENMCDNDDDMED